MTAPLRRLVRAVKAQPRVKLTVLALYFFTSELGGYFTGVVASTLLVKRVGAECLPSMYILLNLAFLPITLSVIVRPPRSNFTLLRALQTGWLLGLVLLIPGVESGSGMILGLVYVVARLGKLLVGVFEPGMVAEILPLREAKWAIPRLVACDTIGRILGGLMLNPCLALLGTRGTLAALWGSLAVAMALLLLLGADDPGAQLPPVAQTATRPAEIYTQVKSTMIELAGSPLVRLIGAIGFFNVTMRYLVEFCFASAQAQHFTTEKAMASFAGNFEAVLAVSAVCVQLGLTVPLMRWLRLGGVTMLMPGSLLVALALALVSPTLAPISLCQFLYWLCYDSFNNPCRQVMVGAVSPALLSRVPVYVTVASILGSMTASLLLIGMGAPASLRIILVVSLLICFLFLRTTSRVGSTYFSTMSQSLEELDTFKQTEVFGKLAAGDAGVRAASISSLLDSPAPEIRRQAALEAAALGTQLGTPRLRERLQIETDASVKASLISTLGIWRPAGMVGVLERFLSDPDPRVRANALEAIAGFPEEPAVRHLVRSHLDAETPRERAAAILATLRLSTSRDELAPAMDKLAQMAADPSDASRAAACAIMGRSGYAFFFPDLALLLSDESAEVRRTAITAIAASHSPVAAEVLGVARKRELNPELVQLLEVAISRLENDTVRSVLSVLDSLSREERGRVRRTISGGGDHIRTAILKQALGITDGQLRGAIVLLVESLSDAALLGVLHRCLVPTAEGETEVDPGPLLEYLGNQREPAVHGYEALRQLVAPPTYEKLAAHLTRSAAKVWKVTALEEAAGQTADERVRALVPLAADRRKALLEHVMTVTGAAAPVPEQALRLMRSALSENRYLSSISLELLEEWIPEAVRAPVFGILEAFPDKTVRRACAANVSGLATDAPADRLLAAAAEEGLV